MGKSRRGDKEFTNEQHLKHENARLKKELGSLRKQLARIDLDRYTHIKSMMEDHMAAEEEAESQPALERMKQEWKCRKCHAGYLEINLYMRMGEPWYFRKCNSCANRTMSQKHSPNVKGIFKKSEPLEK